MELRTSDLFSPAACDRVLCMRHFPGKKFLMRSRAPGFGQDRKDNRGVRVDASLCLTLQALEALRTMHVVEVKHALVSCPRNKHVFSPAAAGSVTSRNIIILAGKVR